MRGSAIQNLKLDPSKQKIVACEACDKQIVVGKFAKKNQKCDDCKNIPKGKASAKKKKTKKSVVRKIETPKTKDTFGKKFVEMASKLGFEPDQQRRFKKKYAIDGGGVATIFIDVEHGISGEQSRVDFFSLITQRAIGAQEEFRRFMPPDAASDCELIASEFSQKVSIKQQVGMEECASCGVMTAEFGVDPKGNRILCVRPNSCFRKYFNNSGAQSEA